MLAETAVVVETGLCVPVAASPLGLAVRSGPGDVLLAEDFLACGVQGCNVCNARTETVLTVLPGCIFRVVGCLGLEIQALEQEAQVKLVLDIEVEDVGALVHVTKVVVVGEGVTVERTYKQRVGDDVTAILVHAATGIRGSALEVTEQEAFAAAHGVAVLHAAAQGDGNLAVLGNVNIQVCTVV